MDKVKKTFDSWAKKGRAEVMEREHSKNVKKFLEKISFKKNFTFLDLGCGNGWVVKMIAKNPNCKRAVGIDKSENMINIAKKNSSPKEQYVVEDLETWKYRGKFDYIFSMESLYYVKSLEYSLEKIFKLLSPGGEFFCGTDFYSDNKATIKWKDTLNLPLHLYSKKEWKDHFKKTGFITKTTQIKDNKSPKKWKREFGTLFIIGTKPH